MRDRPPDWAPSEAQKLYWDRILSREGLHPEPLPKQIRGKRGTPERATWRRREIAMGTEGVGFVEDGFVPKWDGVRPYESVETEIDALMRTRPHEDPMVSVEEQVELGDLLAWAVDQLSEEDQDIWNAHAIEGIGYRTIGKRMGISQFPIQRRVADIRQRLQELLADHPLVQQHLEEEPDDADEL